MNDEILLLAENLADDSTADELSEVFSRDIRRYSRKFTEEEDVI